MVTSKTSNKTSTFIAVQVIHRKKKQKKNNEKTKIFSLFVTKYKILALL